MRMVKKYLPVLLFALLGWGCCAAVIGIGRSVTTMQNTLIIHAIAVPVIFGLISWVYFTKFSRTTPLQTGLIFTGTVILIDGGLIAPFIEKSFAMFTSILGLWIPLASIFLTTYLVGSQSFQNALYQECQPG
jgi:hypothetical protein